MTILSHIIILLCDILAHGTRIQGQLWFSQSGSDLQITVDGTHEVETIGNWFASPTNQFGAIKDGKGASITAAGVDALVQAMSALTPPPMGQMSLSTTQAQQLAPVLAANWQ